MQIRKHVYYDVYFDPATEEDKAVKVIEALNAKGFEDVAAGVSVKKSGKKWLSGADSTGSSNSLVAQVVKTTIIKRFNL